MSAQGPGTGISGWSEGDMEGWRNELAEARKGENTQRTATNLIAAGIAYVGACAWIKPVTDRADPDAGTTGDKLLSFMVVMLFSVAIIFCCFLLQTIKAKLNGRTEAQAQKLKEHFASSGNLRATQMQEKTDEVELVAKLAVLANGKTFDMICGNVIYANVFLWTLSLHSFTSYTTRSGVWTYFFFAFFICASLTILFFEAAPVLTAKLRETCPMLAPAKKEESQLVLVARTFAGSMAWLMAVALVNALEVTITREWPLGDGDDYRACYYSGALHNVPLLARLLLMAVSVGVIPIVLTYLKRSKRNPLRDTVVTALLAGGERTGDQRWFAAVPFFLRFFDRMRGFVLPVLWWTAGQAIIRAWSAILTPHSWSIILAPESISTLTGVDSGDDIVASASKAAAQESMEQSGCTSDAASKAAEALANSTTAGEADTATVACKDQVLTGNAMQDRSFSAACEAATKSICSLDTTSAGGGGCLKWLFKGRCYSSDTSLDCNVGMDDFSGWSEAGQRQCEEVNHCIYQNGTDFWGVCCEKKLLYGVQPLLVLYCIGVMAAAIWYLSNRDKRLSDKLERTIELTAANDPGAEMAQRIFVLHWEFEAMIGGVTAYMVGKVCNDSANVIFAEFKSEHTLSYAAITTTIGIVFILLDASGMMSKVFDCIDAVIAKGFGAANASSSGGNGGGGSSMSIQLIENPSDGGQQVPSTGQL